MITLFFLCPHASVAYVCSPPRLRVRVLVCARVCVRACVQTTEVEIEETVVVQEVSKAAKAGLVQAAGDPPAEQEAKSKEAKRESASSESESEEEAEYRPNVSVSFSDTHIPEEEEVENEKVKEEGEEEKEVAKEEVDSTVAAPDADVAPAALSQEEKARTEVKVEAGVNPPPLEELREVEKEVEESTDDLMVTPEETPNGLAQPGEGLTGVEEEEEQEEKEPRVNGEASLGGAEPRPQVICCSEVKSSPGRASEQASERGASVSSCQPLENRHLSFYSFPPSCSPASVPVSFFLPACVNTFCPSLNPVFPFAPPP